MHGNYMHCIDDIPNLIPPFTQGSSKVKPAQLHPRINENYLLQQLRTPLNKLAQSRSL